jgi:hypothetical protein
LRKTYEQVGLQIDQLVEIDTIINDFEEAQKKLDKELVFRKNQVKTFGKEIESLDRIRNQLDKIDNTNCQIKRKIKLA